MGDLNLYIMGHSVAAVVSRSLCTADSRYHAKVGCRELGRSAGGRGEIREGFLLPNAIDLTSGDDIWEIRFPAQAPP